MIMEASIVEGNCSISRATVGLLWIKQESGLESASKASLLSFHWGLGVRRVSKSWCSSGTDGFQQVLQRPLGLTNPRLPH